MLPTPARVMQLQLMRNKIMTVFFTMKTIRRSYGYVDKFNNKIVCTIHMKTKNRPWSTKIIQVSRYCKVIQSPNRMAHSPETDGYPNLNKLINAVFYQFFNTGSIVVFNLEKQAVFCLCSVIRNILNEIQS